MAKAQYHYGLGRRKSATARARLYPNGDGKITINDKPMADFLDQNQRLMWELVRPIVLLEKDKAFDITLRVSGGGSNGQVDACKLAISNALANIDDDIRSTLKKGGFLKRDPREKERKKYGLKRARKQEQFSKR